jgi:hypothetical protein
MIMDLFQQGMDLYQQGIVTLGPRCDEVPQLWQDWGNTVG